MIKNLLDSVEENFMGAFVLLLFFVVVGGGICALAKGLSSDARDVEMAKLGCSQELVEIHTIPHTDPYIIWKCPNVANK